jgi:hypothetical protein
LSRGPARGFCPPYEFVEATIPRQKWMKPFECRDPGSTFDRARTILGSDIHFPPCTGSDLREVRLPSPQWNSRKRRRIGQRCVLGQFGPMRSTPSPGGVGPAWPKDRERAETCQTSANFCHLLPPLLPADRFLSAAFVGFQAKYLKKLVGGDGLEPPTSCV